MKIPQYEPVIDRQSLAEEVSEYILSNGYFTEFKKTEEFESRLSEILDVKYVHTVNNGTISLSLALLAHGINPGDKVLIPNITMMGTCSAVRLIGAIPVFCDINPYNLCMDLEEAKGRIKYLNIQAVIYVTLNGRIHDINLQIDFETFCVENGVIFIQDNAQSLGSFYDHNVPINNPRLTSGIGSFSFSMPKIITTGQGGCLVTDDYTVSKRIKELKDFGRSKAGGDIHPSFGINSKFTEIQAIMGLNQLKDFSSRRHHKIWLYTEYRKRLSDVEQIEFIPHYGVPWFIDVRVKDRDEFAMFLKENNIGTRNIYPQLSMQECNNEHGNGTMKNSRQVEEEVLWLPSSLSLTSDNLDYICDTIRRFYGK